MPTALIKINELEFLPGKKLNLDSPYVQEGVKRLKQKNKFHVEEYEDVISVKDLLLEIWEITLENNKFRKGENKNVKNT